MSDSGVPVKEIARLAGHTNSRTTETVYRHQLKPIMTTGAEQWTGSWPLKTKAAGQTLRKDFDTGQDYDWLGNLAKISYSKEAAVSDLGSDSKASTERRRPFIGRNKLASQRPQPGIYRHHKGQLYEVIEVALHVDTFQALVVYRALYGEGNLWVRPRSAFIGDVEIDGVKRPRYQKVEDGPQSGEQ